jgi:hypothetical protein
MRKHYSQIAVTLFIIAGITGHAGRLTPGEKDIIKQHIKLCKTQAGMHKTASAEIRNQKRELDQYSFALKILQNNNTRQINFLLKNLEKNKQSAQSSLKYQQKHYQSLKKQIDSIKEDAAKVQEATRLEAKKQALDSEIEKRSRPFLDQKNLIISRFDLNDKHAELKTLLTPHVISSSQRTSGLVNRIMKFANFSSSTFSGLWYKDDNMIASFTIRIKPEPRRIVSQEKILSKYPITSLTNTTMKFWVYNYFVNFSVEEKTWQTEAKLKKLALKLLDINGLARSCRHKVIKQALITYKKLLQLQKERNAAISNLSKQRSNIELKISSMQNQGYWSTKAATKVKKYYVSTIASEKKCKKQITLSDKLTAILNTPFNQRANAISMLKKKIAQTRKNLLRTGLEARQNKTALITDNQFNALNQKYQAVVAKFIKHPKTEKYALINRTIIDARCGNPQFDCRWTLDLSTLEDTSPMFLVFARITYQPNLSSIHYRGMIDHKYRITSMNDYSITVIAGDFTIYMNSDKRIYNAKNAFIAVVKDLIDLEAIADASK